nr:hypothetical protein CFP56_75506 [Quercus suber]
MIQSGDSAAMYVNNSRGLLGYQGQKNGGSYGFDPNVHSSFLPGGVHSGFLTGGALQGAGVQSDLASQNHNGHSGGGDSAQTSHQAASVMTSCPSIPHSLPSTSSSPSTSSNFSGSYGFDPNVHSGFLPGGVHSGFLTGGALQGAGVQSDLASQNHNGHSGGGSFVQPSP